MLCDGVLLLYLSLRGNVFIHKSVIRLSFPVLLLPSVLFSTGGLAGTVNNELGYQLFRDFAENKGMFRPGATNIAIYNKQGEPVGTLDKASMPDFSALDSESNVATLINPQYIASVKHNGGYKTSVLVTGRIITILSIVMSIALWISMHQGWINSLLKLHRLT